MNSGFSDPILDTVAGIGTVLNEFLFDKDPREIIDIIGVEDDRTLVVKNLGLLSILDIKGIYGAVGTTEFHAAIEAIKEGIGSRMKEKSGFLIKLFYGSDPDAAKFTLEENYKGARKHLEACNLQLHDLIDEKIAVNAPLVQKEEIFLAFYTKSSATQAKTESESLNELGDGLTQALIKSDAIKNIHKSTFNSIQLALSKLFRLSHMTSDQMLRNIYAAINGDAQAAKTNFAKFFNSGADEAGIESQRHLPNLKVKFDKARFKDTIRRITEDNNNSLEPINPIRLGDQLVASTCYDSGDRYVVSGNRIYAPVAAYKYGFNLKDFDHLIGSLKRVPFRIAITIAPDGLSRGFLDDILLLLVSVFNEKNRLKERALSKLNSIKATQPIVSVSITASTWSNINRKIDETTGKTFYDTTEVEKRLVSLTTALNDWASVQVKSCAGDLVECLYSTIPGLIGYHCVETVAAPLIDIIQILPITRPCAVWDSGASIYRTEDGRIVPMQQMSSMQASDVILIAGPMGFGKSGQISSLNFSFVIEPSATAQLPFLRGIDFGYSQSGIVGAISSSLPESERYRAKYELVKNEKEYCYNVHDLPLGSREPLQAHKDYLVMYLITLTDSISDFPNHAGMCDAAVRLAYKTYSDKDANPQAKRYQPNQNALIRDFVERKGLVIDEGTTWFGLTDMLFEMGEIRLASIAQRYAVPTIGDYARIASDAEFIQEYNDTFKGQKIGEAFTRAIREVLSQVPMINGYTQFDISQSPVFVADLKDVIPTGEQPRSVQAKSAIIYLTMMRALSADFFCDESDVKYYNPKYRAYHLDRVSLIKPSKKRMFIDEKHRINNIPSASSALDQMVFEGRKYKISILQGSQLLNHFSPDIVKLATSVFVCGTSSPAEVKEIATSYGLSDFHVDLIREVKQPSQLGSQFFVRFQTKEADVSMKLVNTEGPLHLCLIATEADDRAVREGLYRVSVSQTRARQAYAKEFPSGHVADEIKRRHNLNAEGAYKSTFGDFNKDIIADIAAKYNLTV